MGASRTSAALLRLFTGLTLGFIYLPLVVIVLYAFNTSTTTSWPLAGLTTEWFGRAANSTGLRNAFVTSTQAALGATAIALLLGTLASFAVHRFRFFGRETVSFLVILPIALPGIVTGMALNATFRSADVEFGLLTIIVGHATFCVVVVYNNVIARLRRGSRSIEEASMDLGATPWQTFRHVTFPTIGRRCGRRIARVRALVRRSDRHDVHVRRRPADDPDLDPGRLHAPEQPAAGQRRCRRADPALDHPGVSRAADRRARSQRRCGRREEAEAPRGRPARARAAPTGGS
jgi:ABC-type spermidine/putrescine transport system permease subunit II